MYVPRQRQKVLYIRYICKGSLCVSMSVSVNLSVHVGVRGQARVLVFILHFASDRLSLVICQFVHKAVWPSSFCGFSCVCLPSHLGRAGVTGASPTDLAF